MEKAVLPGALSEDAFQLERLQKELRTVAALEVCTSMLLRLSAAWRTLHAVTQNLGLDKWRPSTVSIVHLQRPQTLRGAFCYWEDAISGLVSCLHHVGLQHVAWA